MLFNSSEFFVFFVLVTAAYFTLPARFQWVLLLLASCYFYMKFIPIYILILLFTITVDFFAGLLMEGTDNAKRKKMFLILSIIANVGVLAFFKYFSFLNQNIAFLARLLDWNYSATALRIILPIGLSFHTFQSLSYTIEVYRGRQKAERHFGKFALYVMFYPQLVAGPIERPQNLLHQIHETHAFDGTLFCDGLFLMAWGLFKKVVIADRLAVIVNDVYSAPQQHSGPILALATFFFAFQIYCDFSGYSDMAIGAAEVMGFKLMTNFDRPYFSRSISEFWRRWHISLSTWFRDYFYIPLGGNRVSPPRWAFNIMLTFLVSGLWHGANWTYVMWGFLHGLYFMLHALYGKIAKRLGFLSDAADPVWVTALKVSGTFALVCVTWVYFRANNVQDADYIITHLLSGWARSWNPTTLRKIFVSGSLGLGGLSWVWAFGSILILLTIEHLQRDATPLAWLKRQSVWSRWTFYYGLILSIAILGKFNGSQFIYFQF